MPSQAASADYNLKALKGFRSTRVKRRTTKWISVLLVLVLALSYTSYYFANLPRERHSRKYSYFKRVMLGAERAWKGTYLSIMAPFADPKKTKLPIVELYIRGDKIDKLNSKLPESGRNYKRGQVKIGQEIYKADLRFRGDSLNHWAFPSKSWRVRLSSGKTHKKKSTYNLNVPRSQTQIANWLGYKIAEMIKAENKSALVVPQSKFVHFRLNRQFDGVRLLLDQPNQDFLLARGLPVGKIFNGDITFDQIYRGIPREPLYGSIAGWEVDHPGVNDSKTEIFNLINAASKIHTPYEFYYRAFELLDIDAVLNYMAMLELVGSVHVDNTHNNKYYLNPVSGKLVPLVWDTVAYFWRNEKPIDYPSNEVFKKFLANPALRHQKDLLLWKAIHGNLSTPKLTELVDKVADKLRPDLHAFALKLHANNNGVKNISNSEWEKAVRSLRVSISQRNDYINKLLSEANASYKTENITSAQGRNYFRLGLKVKSHSAIKLNRVKLKLSGSTPSTEVVVKRRGLSDIQIPTKPELALQKTAAKNGVAEFELDDLLYSKRRVRRDVKLVPGNYVYDFYVNGPGKIEEIVRIDAESAITKKVFKLKANPAMTVRAKHKPNSVWWDPEKFGLRQTKVLSGNVLLKQDLKLNRFTDLLIKAGTTIRLDPGVSIFLEDSKLTVAGTPDSPVVIKASKANQTWGVIALQNSVGSSIEHLTIEGGSEKHINQVYYPAALNLYNSRARLSNVKFKNSFVAVRNSELKLAKAHFKNSLGLYIEQENSKISREDITVDAVKPVHSKKLASLSGFGTPAREEREFKYSILKAESNNLDLSDLSKRLLSALSKAVDNTEVWKAPLHTENAYYIDKLSNEYGFLDIYFDTSNRINYEHQLSYRYRNRFDDLKTYKRHVSMPERPAFWPYRLEFQAKTDRKESGQGYSTVKEARFEFRKESQPFSADKLPPPAPWKTEHFMPYFQTGFYKGMPTMPAVSVMKYYADKGISEDLYFEPSLVLLTERHRKHLNIKSEWGSGPNPEQAFIISLDQSLIYDAEQYLQYVNARKLGVKLKKPELKGILSEIEIEFERNVSDILDQKITAAKASGDKETLKTLNAAREAFLEDQKTIMTEVQRYFREEGLEIVSANKSKYVQAVERGF